MGLRLACEYSAAPFLLGSVSRDAERWYHYDTATSGGADMDFLLRDLEPDVVDALRSRAKENGRSLQAEIKDVLRLSLARERRRAFLARVDRFLGETRGRTPLDTTAGIRQDRDAGHKPWLGY